MFWASFLRALACSSISRICWSVFDSTLFEFELFGGSESLANSDDDPRPLYDDDERYDDDDDGDDLVEVK